LPLRADGERYGAPSNFVFDTQAGVIAHKDRIFARAADTNNSIAHRPPTAFRESSA